jgi:twitching motility protein PilT
VTSMMAWLEALVAAKGSDLHLKVGSPPRMRVDGRLVVLDGPTSPPTWPRSCSGT